MYPGNRISLDDCGGCLRISSVFYNHFIWEPMFPPHLELIDFRSTPSTVGADIAENLSAPFFYNTVNFDKENYVGSVQPHSYIDLDADFNFPQHVRKKKIIIIGSTKKKKNLTCLYSEGHRQLLYIWIGFLDFSWFCKYIHHLFLFTVNHTLW